MPQPNDLDEPTVEEAAVPGAWSAPRLVSVALDAECRCPGDCPRDHENE